MDMLGHGQAPDPPGERTLTDFVEQVGEVIEIATGKQRPVLVGFSMGGLIAQAYAIDHHSSLAGLVLISTVHDRDNEQSARVVARYEANATHGADNAVRSGLTRWFTREQRLANEQLATDLELWIRDGIFAAKLKAHLVFSTSDGQLTGKLGVISCPALVMTGEDDAGSTPLMSQKMATAMPRARCDILDGQHHLMTLLDADRVNELLLEFLAECYPATRRTRRY